MVGDQKIACHTEFIGLSEGPLIQNAAGCGFAHGHLVQSRQLCLRFKFLSRIRPPTSIYVRMSVLSLNCVVGFNLTSDTPIVPKAA